MPTDYTALAEQARKTAPVDYAAMAQQARKTTAPASAPMPAPRTVGGEVWEGVKQAASDLNPIPMIDTLGRALIPQAIGDAIGLNVPGKPVSGPVNALNAILGASWEELKKAKQAYDAGDVATATRHVMGSTPIIGPPTSQASDMAERGEYGRAGGRVAAIGVQMAAPEIVRKVRDVKVTSPFRNRNAAEADAVEFAQREGIPVDAATATGNRFVKGAQRGVADQSLGGSVVAERGRAAEAQALTQTGERLAQRAYPTPVTPEQAGQAVQAAVTEKVTGAHAAANASYGRLAAIEKRTPITVDLTAVKQTLAPLHARLMREAEITPLMGGKGRAAVALDRLINGPDQAPLSIVDDALGDLKAMARGADLPELRTQGQGLAAEAVKNLDATVRATAKAAGPDVFDALMSGRLATRAKYGAADVLEQLKTEPVQVFNQAIWQKDAGIDKLRSIAKLAPDEMPKIGRAYLEDLMDKATAQGSFDQTQGLWAQWQKLGPETKRVVFKDPRLITDLDRFFLVAKKMAESPNPSGTALTSVKGMELGAWVWNPGAGAAYSIGATGMAKLLRNPKAVRVLSKGLAFRVGGPKAAATALTTELAGLAKANGVSLVPVTAEQQSAP